MLSQRIQECDQHTSMDTEKMDHHQVERNTDMDTREPPSDRDHESLIEVKREKTEEPIENGRGQERDCVTRLSLSSSGRSPSPNPSNIESCCKKEGAWAEVSGFASMTETVLPPSHPFCQLATTGKQLEAARRSPVRSPREQCSPHSEDHSRLLTRASPEPPSVPCCDDQPLDLSMKSTRLRQASPRPGSDGTEPLPLPPSPAQMSYPSLPPFPCWPPSALWPFHNYFLSTMAALYQNNPQMDQKFQGCVSPPGAVIKNPSHHGHLE